MSNAVLVSPRFFAKKRDGVAASCAFLASAWQRKLGRSAAAPFPTRTAALDSRGGPDKGGFFTPPQAKKRQAFACLSFWCARRDLNPHVRKGH